MRLYICLLDVPLATATLISPLLATTDSVVPFVTKIVPERVTISKLVPAGINSAPLNLALLAIPPTVP